MKSIQYNIEFRTDLHRPKSLFKNISPLLSDESGEKKDLPDIKQLDADIKKFISSIPGESSDTDKLNHTLMMCSLLEDQTKTFNDANKLIRNNFETLKKMNIELILATFNFHQGGYLPENFIQLIDPGLTATNHISVKNNNIEIISSCEINNHNIYTIYTINDKFEISIKSNVLEELSKLTDSHAPIKEHLAKQPIKPLEIEDLEKIRKIITNKIKKIQEKTSLFRADQAYKSLFNEEYSSPISNINQIQQLQKELDKINKAIKNIKGRYLCKTPCAINMESAYKDIVRDNSYKLFSNLSDQRTAIKQIKDGHPINEFFEYPEQLQKFNSMFEKLSSDFGLSKNDFFLATLQTISLKKNNTNLSDTLQQIITNNFDDIKDIKPNVIAGTLSINQAHYTPNIIGNIYFSFRFQTDPNLLKKQKEKLKNNLENTVEVKNEQITIKTNYKIYNPHTNDNIPITETYIIKQNNEQVFKTSFTDPAIFSRAFKKSSTEKKTMKDFLDELPTSLQQKAALLHQIAIDDKVEDEDDLEQPAINSPEDEDDLKQPAINNLEDESSILKNIGIITLAIIFFPIAIFFISKIKEALNPTPEPLTGVDTSPLTSNNLDKSKQDNDLKEELGSSDQKPKNDKYKQPSGPVL